MTCKKSARTHTAQHSTARIVVLMQQYKCTVVHSEDTFNFIALFSFLCLSVDIIGNLFCYLWYMHTPASCGDIFHPSGDRFLDALQNNSACFGLIINCSWGRSVHGVSLSIKSTTVQTSSHLISGLPIQAQLFCFFFYFFWNQFSMVDFSKLIRLSLGTRAIMPA